MLLALEACFTFFKSFISGLFGLIAHVVEEYIQHWKWTVPLTIVLAALFYHYHVVHEYEKELAASQAETVVANKGWADEKQYAQGLASNLEQLSAQSQKLDANITTAVNAAAVIDAKVTQLKNASKNQVIPKDCSGTMSWMRNQAPLLTFPEVKTQ